MWPQAEEHLEPQGLEQTCGALGRLALLSVAPAGGGEGVRRGAQSLADGSAPSGLGEVLGAHPSAGCCCLPSLPTPEPAPSLRDISTHANVQSAHRKDGVLPARCIQESWATYGLWGCDPKPDLRLVQELELRLPSGREERWGAGVGQAGRGSCQLYGGGCGPRAARGGCSHCTAEHPTFNGRNPPEASPETRAAAAAARAPRVPRTLAKEGVEKAEGTEQMIEKEAGKEPAEGGGAGGSHGLGDAPEMRSAVLAGFGGLSKLRVTRKAMPEPQAGELKIRVKACGLNFLDVMVQQGNIDNPPKTPLVPGIKCSGIAEALGDSMRGYEIGDHVMAFVNYDAWEEVVCTPVEFVYKIPDVMSFSEAAAFPMNLVTAYMMLFEVARLREGTCVLVHSAGGGVVHPIW
ncbi:uncharacterized protein LOC130681112 [Manis pentadactyla]|uniref:uncharacterized protein LOC130681112 n=1 Tax=Manis pentadactyla TaxID=143292 RepID=UPI00255CA6CB|nr:uncharacterized protein LOC130681112 [Manis pentadactyla]